MSDIWQDMADMIEQEFLAAGLSGDVAVRQAELAVRALNREYGGRRLGYMPKRRESQRQAMVEAHNGSNGKEVAGAFGVAVSTVYRQKRAILTRKRKNSHF